MSFQPSTILGLGFRMLDLVVFVIWGFGFGWFFGNLPLDLVGFFGNLPLDLVDFHKICFWIWIGF